MRWGWIFLATSVFETDLQNRLFTAYLSTPDCVLVFTFALLRGTLDSVDLASNIKEDMTETEGLG